MAHPENDSALARVEQLSERGISARDHECVLDGTTNNASAFSTFLSRLAGRLGLISAGTLSASGFAKTMTEGDDYRVTGADWESALDFEQSVGTGTGSAVITYVRDNTIRWFDMVIRNAGRMFSGTTTSVGEEPRQNSVTVRNVRLVDCGALLFDTSETAGATISDATTFDFQDIDAPTVNRLIFLGDTAQKAWYDCYIRNVKTAGGNRFGIAVGTTDVQAFAESDRMVYRDILVDDLTLTSGTNCAHMWTHGKHVVGSGLFLKSMENSGATASQSDKEGYYCKVAHLALRAIFLEDCGGDQAMLALKGVNRQHIGSDQVGHDMYVSEFHCNATGDVDLTDNVAGVWVQASDVALRDGVIEGMNNFDIRVHVGETATAGGCNNILIENVKCRRFNTATSTDEQIRLRSQGLGQSVLRCVFEEQHATTIGAHIAAVATGTLDLTKVELGWNYFKPRFNSPLGTESVTTGILLRVEGGNELQDTYVHDNKHSAAQTYGIRFTGSSGVINRVVIEREDFSALSDATKAISNDTTGATLTNVWIRNCQGIVTDNTGTASITSGNTTVDVSHGLTALNGFTVTPAATDIHVVPTSSSGNAKHWWISNIGTTTFRINLDVDPTSTVTFSWRVLKEKWA